MRSNHHGMHWSALIILCIVHANDASILDGEIVRLGIFWIERSDASIVKNKTIRNSGCFHINVFSVEGFNQLRSARVMRAA